MTQYKDKFESVCQSPSRCWARLAQDATVINADKEAVAAAITAEAVKVAGYDDAAGCRMLTAPPLCSWATARPTPPRSATARCRPPMQTLGYDNVFIGTVEGEPEDTACDACHRRRCKEAGYTKVILRPLMVVAGDHANNDMAGD